MTNKKKGISLRTAAKQIADLCESNRHLGRHEAVHAVLARGFGGDVEIKNYEDYAKTSYSSTCLTIEQHAMVIMGPEIYMEIYGYRFTKKSVSDDREQLTEFLCGRDDADGLRTAAKKELENLFADRAVLEAIDMLTEKTGSNPGYVNPVSRDEIHSLIDPILLQSDSRQITGLRDQLCAANVHEH